MSIIEGFRAAIEASGLPAPETILQDCTIHRFHIDGDRPQSENGWYVLFTDEPIGGAFGCWKRGISETWCSKAVETLSPAEKVIFQKNVERTQLEREQIQRENQEKARKKALEIWSQAEPEMGDHPYTLRKKIRPLGARRWGDSIVLSLRDATGSLQGLQLIKQDGSKRYLKGTRKEGAYFAIGRPCRALYICEGYATGASIHEATNEAVAVAFDAGNLRPVAESLHSKFPDLELTICGDDDVWTDGNPGATKAKEAAEAVGGRYILPNFPVCDNKPIKPIDFNDLHHLAGLEEVKRQILAAKGDEKKKNPQNGLEVIRGCDIKPEAIDWLWPGWLPAGKLIVFAGAPGTGKTTLAGALGAILTNGGTWPDAKKAPLADVAIWSGEDDPQDTLAPRLLAAGADMEKIHFIRSVKENGQKRPFDPSKDMLYLSSYLRENRQIKLLIVDPIVSAVSGDSHKNSEVRRNLQPLVELGAECKCAVLGISHFSKGTASREPLERITGSLAFGALARIVLATARIADDQTGKRLFARAKSNIGPDGGGWHYDLETVELGGYPGVITSKINWLGAVDGSARELLDVAETMDSQENRSALEEAKEFLLEILAYGPVPAKEIKTDAESNNIADRTLNRAKRELGVRGKKIGMKEGWVWSLAPKVANNHEDCQDEGLDTFDVVGNLQNDSSRKSEIIQLDLEDFEEISSAG